MQFGGREDIARGRRRGGVGRRWIALLIHSGRLGLYHDIDGDMYKASREAWIKLAECRKSNCYFSRK
jgi:hypothetical protein